MIIFSHEIQNMEDLVASAVIASLLEVSAMKPGNVHRNKDMENTRYEHFLCANVIIHGELMRIAMGERKMMLGLLKAAKQTKIKQMGGNINFGILLLLAPLLTAAGKIWMEAGNVSDFDNLFKVVADIINNTTPSDSICMYKAVEVFQPGGMGVVDELDVNDKRSIEKIEKEKITLKQIFQKCASWDTIASEWVTNFKICREIALPFFMKTAEKTQDLFYSITLTFLRILSEYPDTLITRKTNLNMAKQVSEKAKDILLIKDKSRQIEEIKKFDDYLHEHKGKFNPGTTADLVAATLFLAFLKGMRF